MRKLFLCSLAVLLGGFLLPGCVYTDYNEASLSTGDLLCESDCGGDPPAALLDSAVMGTTAGGSARGFFFPKEPGEYWLNSQLVESQEAGCTRYESGGGNSAVLDTMRNEAAHASEDGCNNGFLCGWLGATAFGNPLGYNFSVCEQPFPVTPVPSNFCNMGNGQCANPHFVGGNFFPIAADSFPTELAYVYIDNNLNGTEFFQNERRNPGSTCDDCSALAAIPTNIPAGSIAICHVPPGNPDNAHTIVVNESALDAHLAHGDSEGPCGAAAGEGNIVDPRPDEQPAPSLGLGFLADFNIQALGGALPWSDDYNGNPLVDERALAELYNVLSTVPTDADGFSQIAIAKLNGPGEDVTLSAPQLILAKLDPLAGQAAFAVDAQSGSLNELVQFILDNTADGDKVDMHTLSMELTNGAVIKGSTLQKVYPFEISLNHARLGTLLDQIEAGTLERGAELDRRISNSR